MDKIVGDATNRNCKAFHALPDQWQTKAYRNSSSSENSADVEIVSFPFSIVDFYLASAEIHIYSMWEHFLNFAKLGNNDQKNRAGGEGGRENRGLDAVGGRRKEENQDLGDHH